MKKNVSLILASLMAGTFMVGCGNDGCETVAPPAPAPQFAGKFVDREVNGVDYKCGDRSGVTGKDINGNAKEAGYFGPCKVGDPVAFSVGKLKLGEIKDTKDFGTSAIVTPKDIAKSAAEDNESIIKDIEQKIAVTLQSMDDDGDPTNGIVIKEEVVQVLNDNIGESEVDLTDPDVTPEEVESNAVEVVKKVAEEHPEIGNEMKPVTIEEAEEHLEETMKEVENGEIAPPPPPPQPVPEPTGAVGGN